MVGDAAHSVLPPTGEGLNSGLEDCNILGQVIDDGGNDYFHRYNEVRSPDIHALMKYAHYLNDSFDIKTPGEGVCRGLYALIETVLRHCGLIRALNVPDNLFGYQSKCVKPYTQIFQDWERNKAVILNIVRACIYPPAFIIAAVAKTVQYLLRRWKVFLLPSMFAFLYRTRAAAAIRCITGAK